MVTSKISKNFLCYQGIVRRRRKRRGRWTETMGKRPTVGGNVHGLEVRLTHAMLRNSDFGKVVIEAHQNILTENSYIIQMGLYLTCVKSELKSQQKGNSSSP